MEGYSSNNFANYEISYPEQAASTSHLGNTDESVIPKQKKKRKTIDKKGMTPEQILEARRLQRNERVRRNRNLENDLQEQLKTDLMEDQRRKEELTQIYQKLLTEKKQYIRQLMSSQRSPMQ